MKIGIDLGGTKTELIALDAAGGQRMRFRRATPAGDYDATIALVADMIRQAENTLHGDSSGVRGAAWLWRQ